jgi:hypothetical protein
MKMLFCASEPIFVGTLVMLAADWYKGRVSTEALVISLVALGIFFSYSMFLIAYARQLAHYGL